MRTIAYRHAAVAGLAAVALIAVGCGNGKSVDASAPPHAGVNATTTSKTPAPPAEVKLIGEGNVEVILTGDRRQVLVGSPGSEAGPRQTADG